MLSCGSRFESWISILNMIRKCPVCKTEYDDGGNSWKRVCYSCYKDFKGFKRIQNIKETGHGWRSEVYIAHPSVTKDEMNEWIKQNKLEIGLGANELDGENWKKFKFFINSVYYD